MTVTITKPVLRKAKKIIESGHWARHQYYTFPNVNEFYATRDTWGGREPLQLAAEAYEKALADGERPPCFCSIGAICAAYCIVEKPEFFALREVEDAINAGNFGVTSGTIIETNDSGKLSDVLQMFEGMIGTAPETA